MTNFRSTITRDQFEKACDFQIACQPWPPFVRNPTFIQYYTNIVLEWSLYRLVRNERKWYGPSLRGPYHFLEFRSKPVQTPSQHNTCFIFLMHSWEKSDENPHCTLKMTWPCNTAFQRKPVLHADNDAIRIFAVNTYTLLRHTGTYFYSRDAYLTNWKWESSSKKKNILY